MIYAVDAVVVACGDFDPDFRQEVGRLRARIRAEGLRISLADCYRMATARRLGGDLLTTDHGEFDPILPLDLCVVRFIR